MRIMRFCCDSMIFAFEIEIEKVVNQTENVVNITQSWIRIWIIILLKLNLKTNNLMKNMKIYIFWTEEKVSFEGEIKGSFVWFFLCKAIIQIKELNILKFMIKTSRKRERKNYFQSFTSFAIWSVFFAFELLVINHERLISISFLSIFFSSNELFWKWRPTITMK